jgi:hypothetical protein
MAVVPLLEPIESSVECNKLEEIAIRKRTIVSLEFKEPLLEFKESLLESEESSLENEGSVAVITVKQNAYS